jgi:hypothetical protein
MKLDFNKSLLSLDGQPFENSNMGKILANSLVNSNKGDAMKFWEIALKLNKGEIVDLDSSDQSTIKEFIKTNDSLPNITKAQILLVFENGKLKD